MVHADINDVPKRTKDARFAETRKKAKKHR